MNITVCCPLCRGAGRVDGARCRCDLGFITATLTIAARHPERVDLDIDGKRVEIVDDTTRLWVKRICQDRWGAIVARRNVGHIDTDARGQKSATVTARRGDWTQEALLQIAEIHAAIVRQWSRAESASKQDRGDALSAARREIIARGLRP